LSYTQQNKERGEFGITLQEYVKEEREKICTTRNNYIRLARLEITHASREKSTPAIINKRASSFEMY
jgi:hypothetical protein